MAPGGHNLIDIVERFESSWRRGEPPNLDEFLALADSADGRRELIELLVPIDVEYRFKSGEEPRADDYAHALGSEAGAFLERVISQMQSKVHELAETVTKSSRSQRTRQSSQIGPYKLLQVIGEGGMGTVWIAEQQFPVRRRVALKLIKSGINNEQVLARFEAERQALAMMDHQNIARVLDAGTTEDRQPYFVMELVQGIPLNKYCDKNRLSVRERLELFVPVCQAVQHAHQKGIIHRDLKPTNILVCLYDGRPVPKVIDFGLAKALQHQVRLTDRTLFTEFGQVVGTLQYMSPEQAEMNQLDVDTRTDIYSLGVILYELLTGFTPIEGELLKQQAVLKILATIREQDPPRPSAKLSSSKHEVVTGLSAQRKIEPAKLKSILRGELDWVVMKALEKDRTRRYSTASGLSQEVERYLAGEPVEARPPSTTYRLGKFVNKNRGLVASLLSVAAILVLGILSTSWYAMEATKARADAEAKRQLAEQLTTIAEESSSRYQQEAVRAINAERETLNEKVKVVAAKELAVQNLEKSNWRLAQSRAQEGRMRDAYALLATIPPEHRDLEWHIAQNNFDKSDFSHFPPWYSKLALNPNGSGVAIASNGQLEFWEPTLQHRLASSAVRHGIVEDLEYSPDGSTIASVGNDGFLRTWDSNTGQLVKELKVHPGACLSCSYHPSGKWIAVSGFDEKTVEYDIRIWDLSVGQLAVPSIISTQKAMSLAFAPHGDWLASSGLDGVAIWDWRSGKTAEALLQHDTFDQMANWPCVAWDPLATRVAAGSANNTTAIWDLAKVEKHQFPGHQEATVSIAWSQDGALLATSGVDTLIRVYDAESYRLQFVLPGHLGVVDQLAFSSDSSRLYSSGWDHTIKSWDLRTGSPDIQIYSGFMQYSAKTDQKSNLLLIEGENDTGPYSSLWDLRRLEKVELPELATRSNAVCMTPDGRQLFAAVPGQGVFRWTMGDWTDASSLFQTDQVIRSLEVSPDSKHLGVHLDDTLQIWNINERESVCEVRSTYQGYQRYRIFSFDSSQFFCITRSTDNSLGLEVRQLPSAEVIQKIPCRDPTYFYPSPKDHTLALTSPSDERILEIRDIPTSQTIGRCVGHEGWVNGVAYSPSGSRIATSGSRDRTIRLWDWKSGEEIMSLFKLRPHHSGYVARSVLITPDANWIVVTSIASPQDPTSVTLINASKDKDRRFFTTENAITRTGFSEDRRLLLTETQDGKQQVWEFEQEKRSFPDEPSQHSFDLDFKWTHDQWNLATNHNLLIANKRKNDQESIDEIYRRYKLQFDPVWNAERIGKIKLHIAGMEESKPFRNSLIAEDTFLHWRYRLLARQYLSWKSSSQTFEDLAGLIKTHNEWLGEFQKRKPWIRQNVPRSKSSDQLSDLPIDDEIVNSLTKYFETMEVQDRESAEFLNQLVWNEIKAPKAAYFPFLIDVENAIYQKFPNANFLNTLGTAYFREGRYQDAIEALSQSLIELQKEFEYPAGFPGDLAVLAMSELALGNRPAAQEWYRQLNASMEHPIFKDDGECVSFLQEAKEMFAKQEEAADSK